MHKSMENDEEVLDTPEEEVISDNDTPDEDNGDTEGDQEEEQVTLTKAELDERIKAARKEQDKRWKERLDNAKKGAKEPKSEDGGDRIDRLELKAEGIKDREQQDFVLEYAKVKKIDISAALESSVVKAELRDMQEKAKKIDAIPTPSTRTQQPRQDDVGYWAKQLTEKGKQAPTPEMRSKVLRYLAGNK